MDDNYVMDATSRYRLELEEKSGLKIKDCDKENFLTTRLNWNLLEKNAFDKDKTFDSLYNLVIDTKKEDILIDVIGNWSYTNDLAFIVIDNGARDEFSTTMDINLSVENLYETINNALIAVDYNNMVILFKGNLDAKHLDILNKVLKLLEEKLQKENNKELKEHLKLIITMFDSNGENVILSEDINYANSLTEGRIYEI